MNLFAEADGRLNGLEQLQSLIDSGRKPPIYELLDFALVEVGKGRAVFQAIPGARAYNPLGAVHGGFAATVLDSACGCAVHSSLTADQAYTTLELKVQFHRAITSETGKLRAEGKLTTLGRRVAFAEARLIDADGRLYASASSTLLILQR